MAVQRLTSELGSYGGNDFRIAVPDVEDPESAEAIDIFFARNVAIAIWSGVGPLDRGGGVLDRRCFPVFEKAGIDVIAETVDGFPRDPLRILRCNGGRFDEF